VTAGLRGGKAGVLNFSLFQVKLQPAASLLFWDVPLPAAGVFLQRWAVGISLWTICLQGLAQAAGFSPYLFAVIDAKYR